MLIYVIQARLTVSNFTADPMTVRAHGYIASLHAHDITTLSAVTAAARELSATDKPTQHHDASTSNKSMRFHPRLMYAFRPRLHPNAPILSPASVVKTTANTMLDTNRICASKLCASNAGRSSANTAEFTSTIDSITLLNLRCKTTLRHFFCTKVRCLG